MLPLIPDGLFIHSQRNSKLVRHHCHRIWQYKGISKRFNFRLNVDIAVMVICLSMTMLLICRLGIRRMVASFESEAVIEDLPITQSYR